MQLPLLDNDTKGPRENFPFAGAYLDHALRRSTESPYHASLFPPPSWDDLDTPHLAMEILEAKADILACTLYLWNIERTIDLARRIKRENPNVRIVAGGPEVARNHPLLETAPFDAIVAGEGEAVFPILLYAWRTSEPVDIKTLAFRGEAGFLWGQGEPPSVDLEAAQPGEDKLIACMGKQPIAFIETVRGCPLSCSYCRYHQLHSGLRTLSAKKVVERIRRFQQLGISEIRFVDPTFNARKDFSELLCNLMELNHDHRLSFFAEIRADTITEAEADLMAEANFTEVEIGVQSIDPNVLGHVGRPRHIARLEQGIRRLHMAGVRTILDVMYGLPQQTKSDVENTLEWCLNHAEDAQVQCMQTLCLPGTLLRQNANADHLESDPLPPYGIIRTPHISTDDIREIEHFIATHPRLPADPQTPRFCSQRLSGLFPEQYRIGLDALDCPIPGRTNRRALVINWSCLFQNRSDIAALIDRALRSDPFTLWQFVLEPVFEEPLDLLDFLIEAIRRHPTHMLDRFASAASRGRLVSRRLYVRIRDPKSFSPDWRIAAEELLSASFG